MNEKPLTPHQRGIIRRYYEHREDLGMQKLSEVISDLYLETSPKKVNRLWKSAFTALKNAGVKEAEAKKLTDAKDLAALARKAEEIF